MPARTNPVKEGIKHGILWFILFFSFLPFALMLVISVKTNEQFARNPFFPDAPGAWHWENWAVGWRTVGTYIANSIVTSAAAVLLCLVMAVLASYVLARYRFPGREIVYYGLIVTMFLPSTVATLVTTFTLVAHLHMYNSLSTLVILGAVGGQVVCVFILRQFIEEIPKELFESAEIDGAGHLRQIANIVLPMSGSVLSTLAIMQFISNWNNLLGPLVFLRDEEKLTVPVGLMRLEGEYVKEWGQLMAGYTLSSVPLVILFLFTMRLFIRGLAAGAVKG
jgi:ABC-type glycerol-3-phosphate transport system permease component